MRNPRFRVGGIDSTLQYLPMAGTATALWTQPVRYVKLTFAWPFDEAGVSGWGAPC